MGTGLTFLQQYYNEGSEYLIRIVMGDEIWVAYFTAHIKQQLMYWHHSGSVGRTKFKQIVCTHKMAAQSSGTGMAFCSLASYLEAMVNVTVQCYRTYNESFRERNVGYSVLVLC